MTRIVCSAIKFGDKIICGPRHNHCFEKMTEQEWKEYSSTTIQGFVDERNNFHNRKEALKIVLENNQEIRFDRELMKKRENLFSEDLY